MPNEVVQPVAIAVTVDLLARSRIEDAAVRAGWKVETATARTLSQRIVATGADLLILDLDAGGKELLDAVRAAGESQDLPARVIGFYSHVDAELGAAAAAAGCDAMPRGRFWRTLPELLGPV